MCAEPISTLLTQPPTSCCCDCLIFLSHMLTLLADDILHRTSPSTEAMEGIHTIMPVSGELHPSEQCDGKMQMHVEPCTPASSVCSTKSRLFSPKLLKNMVLHLQHPVTLMDSQLFTAQFSSCPADSACPTSVTAGNNVLTMASYTGKEDVSNQDDPQGLAWSFKQRELNFQIFAILD